MEHRTEDSKTQILSINSKEEIQESEEEDSDDDQTHSEETQNEIEEQTFNTAKKQKGSLITSSKAAWEWEECNPAFLKSYDTLTPEINSKRQKTQNDLESASQNQNQRLKLNVLMDKSFMYSQKFGWNWHKCWNLPTITVYPEHPEELLLDSCMLPLQMELAAIKVENHDLQASSIRKTGLEGDCMKPLDKSGASFRAIKFTSTSFNNNGARFRLVVSVSGKDKETKKQVLVAAYMSPFLFVDSRRSSRDSTKSKREKTYQKYFSLFPPRLMSQSFVKVGKRPRRSESCKIENNIQGFCDYLTAGNIKNKVKHLLFLVMKFSNCLKLYYNTKLLSYTFQEKEKLQEIIVELCCVLHEIEHNYNGNLSKQKGFANTKMEEAAFMILVEDDNKGTSFDAMKTISEQLEILKHPKLIFNLNKRSIPCSFLEASSTGLVDGYKSTYPIMSKMKGTGKDFIKSMREYVQGFKKEIVKPVLAPIRTNNQSYGNGSTEIIRPSRHSEPQSVSFGNAKPGNATEKPMMVSSNVVSNLVSLAPGPIVHNVLEQVNVQNFNNSFPNITARSFMSPQQFNVPVQPTQPVLSNQQLEAISNDMIRTLSMQYSQMNSFLPFAFASQMSNFGFPNMNGFSHPNNNNNNNNKYQ